MWWTPSVKQEGGFPVYYYAVVLLSYAFHQVWCLFTALIYLLFSDSSQECYSFLQVTASEKKPLTHYTVFMTTIVKEILVSIGCNSYLAAWLCFAAARAQHRMEHASVIAGVDI